MDPTFSDLILTENLFGNSEIFNNNFNSNFHKLEYAFGFMIKEFTSELEMKGTNLWKHNGQIRLRDHDFILVKRYFSF